MVLRLQETGSNLNIGVPRAGEVLRKQRGALQTGRAGQRSGRQNKKKTKSGAAFYAWQGPPYFESEEGLRRVMAGRPAGAGCSTVYG